MMIDRNRFDDAAGVAAISICESLLIALIDCKVISAIIAHDLLADVMSTHTAAAALSPSPAQHLAVVRLIERMQLGQNHVAPSSEPL